MVSASISTHLIRFSRLDLQVIFKSWKIHRASLLLIFSNSHLRFYLLPWINLFSIHFGQYSSVEEDRAFRAYCGVVPQIAEAIFLRYYHPIGLKDRTQVLMLLHYLKTYPTEEIGSRYFKITRKTYRKRVSLSLAYLDAVMNEVLC